MRWKLVLVVGLGISAVILLGFNILREQGSGAAAASAEAAFDLENLTIPRDEMHRGGPAKDGIPAITDPDVAPVSEVDFLDPDDRVIGVTIDGQSRAYPIALLNWHEAVNDRLGDTPFAVTYCPLCDSVSVFDRRVDDEVLEFGISGLLYNSNVLLYDRTHDALWSQIGFEAVSGPYAGQTLKHLPFELMTFEQWQAEHPDSDIATFDTGHGRAYNRNPYEQYFEQDGLMFPAKTGDDDRLGEKEPVIGIQTERLVRAYPLDRIAAAPEGRVEEAVEGGRIVLEVSPDDGQIRVVETPDDARVIHTFWFAWVAFHPETTIYGDDAE